MFQQENNNSQQLLLQLRQQQQQPQRYNTRSPQQQQHSRLSYDHNTATTSAPNNKYRRKASACNNGYNIRLLFLFLVSLTHHDLIFLPETLAFTSESAITTATSSSSSSSSPLSFGKTSLSLSSSSPTNINHVRRREQQRWFHSLQMTVNPSNMDEDASPADADDDSDKKGKDENLNRKNSSPQPKRSRNKRRPFLNNSSHPHPHNNQHKPHRSNNHSNHNQHNHNSHHPKSTLNQTAATTTTTAAATTATATPLVIPFSPVELELLSRVKKLEGVVAKQSIEMKRLKDECRDLTDAVAAFAHVIELLRAAGLQTKTANDETEKSNEPSDNNAVSSDASSTTANASLFNKKTSSSLEYIVDEAEIFGSAPSSLTDAADAAGAAILAGMLGGKQRMLIDVRDAELSRDAEILVQFIELAILPVAAGLEGLQSTRNRVKIVFPTVLQLLQYRRTMALAAPEVVALSTLGFDPVEKRDNLVVIVAPAPDDEEGLMAMNELFAPTDPAKKPVRQPVVVLNHHMMPVVGPAASFEVAYHLRLLSVQYMSSDVAPQYFPRLEEEEPLDESDIIDDGDNDDLIQGVEADIMDTRKSRNGSQAPSSSYRKSNITNDATTNDALEAAMKHAHEVGMNQGVTRAMVIRAYPRPWHVFVDTSPDTNADFEVAATFDEEPTQEEVNMAIVECLEGSEREDELVAHQMQEALESGQLDRVSELLQRLALTDDGDDDEEEDGSEDDEDDLFGDFDRYEEDSV